MADERFELVVTAALDSSSFMANLNHFETLLKTKIYDSNLRNILVGELLFSTQFGSWINEFCPGYHRTESGSHRRCTFTTQWSARPSSQIEYIYHVSFATVADYTHFKARFADDLASPELLSHDRRRMIPDVISTRVVVRVVHIDNRDFTIGNTGVPEVTGTSCVIRLVDAKDRHVASHPLPYGAKMRVDEGTTFTMDELHDPGRVVATLDWVATLGWTTLCVRLNGFHYGMPPEKVV